MFICAITGKMSRHGDPRIGEWGYINESGGNDDGIRAPEKVHFIVVETRQKVYKQRVFNEMLRQSEEIEVGHGFETVREIQASQEGFDLWNSWTADQQAAWVKNKYGKRN